MRDSDLRFSSHDLLGMAITTGQFGDGGCPIATLEPGKCSRRARHLPGSRRALAIAQPLVLRFAHVWAHRIRKREQVSEQS